MNHMNNNLPIKNRLVIIGNGFPVHIVLKGMAVI
jgi:hypothetical protein